MRKILWLSVLCFSAVVAFAQEPTSNKVGIIIGNLLDSTSQKPVINATIVLSHLQDSSARFEMLSDKNGSFSFKDIPFGYYRLSITAVGMSPVRIDSIHLREERFDFSINDIQLSNKPKELETVIIYAEKPLIQSKDGNITFNAAESALAAGSNANELLNNVPLVTKDPDGKILVRGKEPKILIDEKPVELNLQQLQDLLESLPGSSIEKIEVMTNPPPQYASEQGGVINITTRKGKVGMGGRINISAGTRGEASLSGNFNYRKNKFAINVNAGVGINRFEGYGNSQRTNFYNDSTNYLNTENEFLNKNTRPNIRVNMDYEFTKQKLLNFVVNFNQNDFDNRNVTEYTNINRFDSIYKLSERTITSDGNNRNLNASLSYLVRSKKTAGEQLRIITGSNLSRNENNRRFFQEYFNPDHTPNGIDSTQDQVTNNKSSGYNVRINYEKPLFNKKTFYSGGTAYTRNNSHILVDARYMKKPEGIYVKSDLLSNNFKYHQEIINLRSSIRQVIAENFSVTAGIAAEATLFGFDLIKDQNKVDHSYWNFLPFGNINKSWKEKYSLTFSYRRTIRRPGINELNPTIDFSDPYNIRFGNYQLDPSLAHNFDLVFGHNKPKYFTNLGVGFNLVEDIFSPVRTLLSDGKTQVTWENISDRKEYEISTWNGYTLSKKIKLNLSASYIYNEYDAFEKSIRKFRDGGSFTANFNGNYSMKDIWNFTGNFTTNRFANPQGSVNWKMSMNLGIQRKLLEKKFIITLNIIDPFLDQQTRGYTYGSRFELRSYNRTETGNYRLSLAYNFSKQSNPVKVKGK